MKKIPTIFERDWNGDRSRVVNKPNPKCQWVFDGEGVATRKIDGTCCRILNGELWKRRELRKGEVAPDGFEVADFDEETGKTVGWLRVGDGPEDRWHHEAFAILPNGLRNYGTYELIGPKIQGNPEKTERHFLVPHVAEIGWITSPIQDDVPRTFEGISQWLREKDIEGIVFHHPDGRMGKIKLRDFGLKRRG